MKRKYIVLLPFLLLTGCSNISNNVYKDIIINKINDYNYHIKDAKTFNKKSYNEAKEKVIKDINNRQIKFETNKMNYKNEIYYLNSLNRKNNNFIDISPKKICVTNIQITYSSLWFHLCSLFSFI